MTRAVVLAAVRTPVGRYGGGLAGVRPDDLAAIAIAAARARAAPTGTQVSNELPDSTCTAGVIRTPGVGNPAVTVQLRTNATPAANSASCAVADIGAAGPGTYVP